MAGFDLTEGVRKVFLAGVGAVALTAERSQAIIDDLVSKGELTVEQGKALNTELTRKVRASADDSEEAVLRLKLKNMTPEERAAWVARTQKLAADLDSETVTVDVEEVKSSEAAE